MKKYRVVKYDGRFWVQHRSWLFWLHTEEVVMGEITRVVRNTLDEAKEFIKTDSHFFGSQIARVVYEYPEPRQ